MKAERVQLAACTAAACCGGRHGLGAELVQLAGAQLGQLQLGVGAQGRGGGCHGVGAELAQLHLDGGMGGRWRRHRVLQS